MAMQMVRVPKAVAAEYWHQPWSAVVAAAERGADGCSFALVRVLEGGHFVIDEALVPGHAYLRAADRSWPTDKTLLFQQTW